MPGSTLRSRKMGVVGASGRLGRIIVHEATRAGFGVRKLSARQEGAGQGVGQWTDRGLADLDAVLIAAPQTSNELHKAALEADCHVIDVGIAEDTIRSALDLDKTATERKRTLLVMAGLAPGLSGMVGHDMAKRFPSAKSVDVILLQNTDGTAGKRGTCDMLDMLTDSKRSAIAKLREDAIPKAKKAGQFAFVLPTPERNLLPESAHGPSIQYYTLFDRSSMNGTIRILRTLRRISGWFYRRIRNRVAHVKSMQPPPTEEAICLSVLARDVDGSILGREDLPFASDYDTTAQVAVALADMAMTGQLAPGAGHPVQFTDWRRVTERISGLVIANDVGA